MYSELRDSASTGADLVVTLDGHPVPLPSPRRSLAAIRCYLETMAMERQRLLFSFRVDGARINLSAMLPTHSTFTKVEAETIDLAQVPLQLVKTALTQTVEAREKVQASVAVVLINEAGWAREHWWNLVRVLKAAVYDLELDAGKRLLLGGGWSLAHATAPVATRAVGSDSQGCRSGVLVG